MNATLYHLAQINIARLLAPIDDPRLADFVARLDEINALAERSPGFVWRLQTADGNATAIRPYPDDLILVNMSVWRSFDTLFEYAYRSEHVKILRERQKWFEKPELPTLALWWIPAGEIPSVEEAKSRLEHLRTHGPTEYAFNFKVHFPEPGRVAESP